MEIMGKSSINVQPVKGGSEKHNEREKLEDLDYVRADLTHKNESWKSASISAVRKDIEQRYTQSVGQKMQAKATPIREGVFLFEEHHTLADAARLADKIQEKFGIKTFQIHMHRDEGRWIDKDGKTLYTQNIQEPPARGATWKANLHGHLVFDWTNDQGKSIKMNREKMAELQTLVANEMGMERGVSSDRKHLDALTYKIEARGKELSQSLDKSIEELKVAEKGLLGRERINQEATILALQRALENNRLALLKYQRLFREQKAEAKRVIETKQQLERKLNKISAAVNGMAYLVHDKRANLKDVMKGLHEVLPEPYMKAIEKLEKDKQLQQKKETQKGKKNDLSRDM